MMSEGPPMSTMAPSPPHNPPPPPPPPPIPPSVPSPDSVTTKGLSSKDCTTETPVTKKGIFHEHIFSTSEDQIRKACHWFIRDSGLTDEKVEEFVFISNYQPVKPVIQNGPLCGMVALAMASQLTGEKIMSTEDIFEEAKRHGFSLQGEMFSASFMQELASKFFDCDVKLVTLNPNGQSDCLEASRVIIKTLLQHNLIIFPYDADKNHGPCQAKGHKAHWALITGFFTAFKKETFDSDLLHSLRQDTEIKCLYYLDSQKKFDSEEFVTFLAKHAEFKLFIHQGKSKYCGTWNLQDMLDSNSNLIEVGPARELEGEYILPPGGVQEGLRHKAVFICPPRGN